MPVPKQNCKLSTAVPNPSHYPSITIPNEQTYLGIKNVAESNDINIRDAKEKYNRIKLYSATADDHRKITKILVEKDQEYYYKPVDDQKSIRAVIKRIPKFIKIDDIKIELELQGFQITQIDRIYKKKQTQWSSSNYH